MERPSETHPGRRAASWAAFLALALLTGTGCSTRVEVESSGCWTGSVSGGSVQGCGAQTWSAKAGECYVFQKAQQAGYLRARVKGYNGNDRWVETSADYGVVTVCANH
jgi:hypothetical protein